MFRTQAARVAQTTSRAATKRAYATYPPPPSGQPAPQPKSLEKSNNTLLYVGLGLAGAAGAYYYFNETDEPAALEKQARKDEERVRVNARQTLDAAKDSAYDAAAISRARAEQVKDDAKGALYAGRSKAEQLKDDAKHELDTTKSAFRNATREGGVEEGRGLFDKAGDSLTRTKEETEAAYRNARDAAEQKAADLKGGVEKKGEEVKEGWFSWLGYGKTKVADAEQLAKDRRNQLEAEADRLKREAARGVANTAEDVRVRAEKHA